MNKLTPAQQWENWHGEWVDASWNFTYNDENQTDKPVLQGGLLVLFYFVNSAQLETRKSISEALLRFHQKYRRHLQWGTFGPKVNAQPYSVERFMECVSWITQEDANRAVEFTWASGDGLEFVGSYQINAFSISRWNENVHGGVSYLRIHLPFEALESDGRAHFVSFMAELGVLLHPLHGYAGLGFQQCYEYSQYEHLEFEHAFEFNGLDVGHPLGADACSVGIKSINWLTFLDAAMLLRLGGKAALRDRASRINRALQIQGMRQGKPPEQLILHFYDGGVMVQAGEWPRLGWVKSEPYPAAYVAANLLLRPARVPELGSLHMGSVVGEARFDKHTSTVWLRRFDAASDEFETALNTPVHELPASASVSRQAPVPGGEPCPEAGWWFTFALPGSRRYFEKGEVMPVIKGNSFGDTNWQRDSNQQDRKS
jgi:hypothetical protein